MSQEVNLSNSPNKKTMLGLKSMVFFICQPIDQGVTILNQKGKLSSSAKRSAKAALFPSTLNSPETIF